MRVRSVGSRTDGDFDVYSVGDQQDVDEQPLFDLRTRLVIWVLCLLIVGLVYLGLHSPIV